MTDAKREIREIDEEELVEAVARLCVEANARLPDDVTEALRSAREAEESGVGREVLGDIIENDELAAREGIPMCQDCGLAVVFVDKGRDAHCAFDLTGAIDEGVRRGYERGYLRKSVVADPLERVNTRDNTPAVVHLTEVEGDRVTVTVAPKGGGSENMSRARLLAPAAGWEGVKRFALDTISDAGGNPCPPVIVGVGVGGNFERSTLLAKRVLVTRAVGERNRDERWAERERELLAAVNALGIGPMGMGGRVTALDVFIEVAPCHIASLPVAVNVQCHAARHASATL